MNWNTLYITGNADFWEDVNKKLSQSELNYLPGYMEQRPDKKFHGLYWIDNQAGLRQIKEAIGGKIIWKYRLYFLNEMDQRYSALEDGTDKGYTLDELKKSIDKLRRKKYG